jgi:putative ABC transport system substrate-binding protein
MMNRRAFVAGLGAVLAAPLGAEAQQAPRIYGIGAILQGGPYYATIDGLRDGLRELGLEEGKQFILHVRDTKGDLKAVEAAARSLEEQKIDLIYTVGGSVTSAAKRTTKSVPIVFYAGADPVALTAKRLELLKEMIPRLRRVVTFYSPDNAGARRSVTIALDAARQLKVELVERPVASVEELRAGLRALQPGEVDAFFFVSDAMVNSQQELIIETARAKRIAVMTAFEGIVVDGVLASYGESYYILGRLSAKLVKRVLLGAKPGDLPVEQLDKLHLVINLKTAKALGLTIPASLLLRADQVIE